MQLRVVYKDETKFDGKYGDIDRSQVKSFQIVSDEGKVVHSVNKNLNYPLIWRRRMAHTLGQAPQVLCHMIGWLNGKDTQDMYYIFPDHIEHKVGKLDFVPYLFEEV
jgi:hypothetical protein